jgi:hypothetical protein
VGRDAGVIAGAAGSPAIEEKVAFVGDPNERPGIAGRLAAPTAPAAPIAEQGDPPGVLRSHPERYPRARHVTPLPADLKI